MSAEEHVQPAPSVGRYDLGARIGSGGMATVYLARSHGPEGFLRLAALKVIHEHLLEERQYVDMFLDEARIASRIQHPNVCQVYDFGEGPFGFYIAMEYLEGFPLAAFVERLESSALRRNPRREAVFTRIIDRAAAGLHAAHEARTLEGVPLHVVHRDVSPQNLFLTFDGVVKVVDFGIASAVDRVHRTHTGGVKGKFAYMSPEQASGTTVDRRADVWALGVVAWEALTGERLFQRASPVQSVLALATEAVPPPSTFGVSAAFDAPILRALDRDLDARYPTARDFARELSRAARSVAEPSDDEELEEWMQALFEGDRERQRARVRDSAWSASPRSEPDELPPAGEISGVASRDVTAPEPVQPFGVIDSTTPELVPMAAHVEAHDTLRPAAPSSRFSRPMLYVALGCLAGAALSLALLVSFGPGERDDDAPRTAEAAGDRRVEVARELAVPEIPSHLTPPTARAEPSSPAAPDVDEPSGDVPSDDEPSDDVPSDDVPSDDEPSDDVASDDVASDDVASDDVPSDDVPSDDEPSDDTVAERGAHRDATDPAQARGSSHPARRAAIPSRRARRTTPAPAAATGTVVITTRTGFAYVYDERGRHLGETPLVLTRPAGPLRLSLRPNGQPPARAVTVEVLAGQRTTRAF
ncbi:MAG: protein kinase [Sandaracinaceae bacterium]